jgi:hypothetical protein
MMGFSATEAAFEGFRIARRAPLTVVFWSLVYVVSFIAMFALLGSTLADLMATSEAMDDTEPSLTELGALASSFAWLMGVSAPIMLLTGAVLSAAVARAVLSPADKALGYLRLGADELRVLATSLIVGVTLFALMLVLYMVIGAIGFAAYSTSQGWMWLLVVLGGLAGVGLMIWVAIRLSLAIPIAMAEKRIAPFASFSQTKGHFWPLLGMALLAGIMSILVSLLVSIVALPLTLALGGMDKLAAYEGQATLTILTLAWPMILGWTIVNAVSTALQLALTYAPFTAAYLMIKGKPLEG